MAGAEGSFTAREAVLAAMRERPTDPWPRGTGHVVLAIPGSGETDKSYHEPGGSFSPAPGSFGISLWVVAPDGKLVATSDDIPPKDITQRFEWPSGEDTPAILTRTPHYEARWSVRGRGTWRLDVGPGAEGGTRLLVVVRSTGPAGGPVRTLEYDGKQLTVNGAWRLELSPGPVRVLMGEEGTPGWTKDGAGRDSWKSAEGWGYAALETAPGRCCIITIEGPLAERGRRLEAASCVSPLVLDLPSPGFVECLRAQAAHLLMGLVGAEPRPGDPMNYPLAWLRDGSHTVAALAQAGHLGTARELGTMFATEDFFGGFGAEGDSPGLAIWALEQVAARAGDPGYDEWLWPHVARKAGLILEMLAARGPIHKAYSGPVVPAHRGKPELDLIAEAAADGLIRGRMDHHYPILFVNAAGYAGLECAAAVAGRTGHPGEADRFRKAAAEVKKAWRRAFAGPEAENERTYVFALWPSGVASSVTAGYREKLEERWEEGIDAKGDYRKTPLWTYFCLAEAHQWLYLGAPERTWAILRWFMRNQASPGLFTWWEGEGEENTFHQWEHVRGWVKPGHVTPHYWTAAEMLLLQTDMLGYLSGDEMVVGAGVPEEWLGVPVRVDGIRVPGGTMGWTWDGRSVQARVPRSFSGHVHLGTGFPAGTAVAVRPGGGE